MAITVSQQTSAHERLARRQESVAALGHLALASDDLQALMDRAVRRIAESLDTELAAVLELHPDGESLLLLSGVGWRSGTVGRAVVDAGKDSQAGLTLLADEPVIFSDLRKDRRFKSTPLLREHRVVSGASVVIPGDGRPYGVLAAYTRKPREFTREDIHLLRAIANILAAAVKHQRILDALRDSEARMRAVVDTAVDGIITIDEHGLMDWVNPAACRLFGYAREELVGRNVSMLMPAPYSRDHDGYIASYLRTGHAKIIGIGREVVGRRKDGHVFPMDLAVSELSIGGQGPGRSAPRRMFTGIVRDITDRRRLQQEIIDASAEEQRRIGQDLHDGLCQHLAGIAFGIEVLNRKLAARSSPETAGIEKVATLVDQAITQARDLARGLQPVTLEVGLPHALESLATKVETLFHVSCRLVRKGICELDNPGRATHLYRIVQEAISNAVKHGKARVIVIELTESRTELTLHVKDDGIGLKKAKRDRQGMGLRTMAYRANLIGGRLTVRPGERGGTIVTCVLPLHDIDQSRNNHGPQSQAGRKAKDANPRRRRSPHRSRASG